MKMNRLFLTLTTFAAVSAFVSCSDDDTTTEPIPSTELSSEIDAEGNWNTKAVEIFSSKIDGNNGTGANEDAFAWTVAKGGTTLPIGNDISTTEILEGEITTDLELDASIVYELRGAVFVKSGATLTIPAGTVIVADASNNANTDISDVTAADVLIANKGGKIIANGTGSNPIIFTSAQGTSGSWGGIVLLGDAPINIASGNAEIADNVGEDLPYGGSNASDNSGTLNYVILAYPGTQINTDSEYNGFSFYAVGSGTTLTNLEVVQGKDDGFEWFGGTVNATNLVTENFDDAIDCAEGFVGTLDNVLANQPEGADHCIEFDNLKSNNDATPRSRPTVKNATFNSVGADDAIKLRRGASVILENIVINIDGTSNANFEIDDLSTALKIQDGTTIFKNIKLDTENVSFDGNINL